MTIEKLISITNAKEINETDISEVYSASVYPKKVTHGDLFIGSDSTDIELAIQNGATFIMSDLNIDVTVGFLKVQDLEDAALKIVSHIVKDDEDLYFYLLYPHTLSFAKMIMLDKKNIEYIPNDYRRAFEIILNSKKTIFLSHNKELMRNIKPNIKIFKKSIHGYNVEDTLFRSTFRAGKYVYQHKKMAPFHLSFLLEAVALCEEQKLSYDIDRISYTKHFRPIFIEEETGIQSTHKNDHAVIVCDNLEDINEGRKYAKEAKVIMSKSIVFTTPKVKVESYTNPIIFTDSVSLVTVVKTTSFNYGFVYSKKDKNFEALREYFI